MRFRIRVDVSACTGCELCVAVCPYDVLDMTRVRNGKGPLVVRVCAVERCEGCQRCVEACPVAALEVEREQD